MTTDASPWIGALRHSHDRLAQVTEPLPKAELSRQSYAAEWSFPRLVYGRLDAGHTPPCEAAGVSLDELRTMFPGF